MATGPERKIEADIVISVPTGILGCIRVFFRIRNPLCGRFDENRYIGRTFIQPDQAARNIKVKLKLNPVKEILQGKRVIMVDDSIVGARPAARSSEC